MALVTKLDSVVNDDELMKLGYIRLHMISDGNEAKTEQWQLACVYPTGSHIKFEIVGDGHFTDAATRTENLGKVFEFDGNSFSWKYVSFSAGNYYVDIPREGLSLLQVFSQQLVNTNSFHFNAEQLEYCKLDVVNFNFSKYVVGDFKKIIKGSIQSLSQLRLYKSGINFLSDEEILDYMFAEGRTSGTLTLCADVWTPARVYEFSESGWTRKS